MRTMILLAGSMILATSLFMTALLRTSSKPSFLLSLYLLGFANVVRMSLDLNMDFRESL